MNGPALKPDWILRSLEALRSAEAQLARYDAAILRIHRVLVGADPDVTGSAKARCDHAAGIALEFIEARELEG